MELSRGRTDLSRGAVSPGPDTPEARRLRALHACELPAPRGFWSLQCPATIPASNAFPSSSNSSTLSESALSMFDKPSRSPDCNPETSGERSRESSGMSLSRRVGLRLGLLMALAALTGGLAAVFWALTFGVLALAIFFAGFAVPVLALGFPAFTGFAFAGVFFRARGFLESGFFRFRRRLFSRYGFLGGGFSGHGFAGNAFLLCRLLLRRLGRFSGLAFLCCGRFLFGVFLLVFLLVAIGAV